MSGAFDWTESIRDEGVVRAPFASVRSAMVHDSDIGAVIAAVLTQDGHAAKTYTLTGPRAMTIPQKVTPTVEQITGRPALTLQDFIREHASRYQASSHARAGW
jgi:uncharacterized protein YbjT (DUF2867 family)